MCLGNLSDEASQLYGTASDGRKYANHVEPTISPVVVGWFDDGTIARRYGADGKVDYFAGSVFRGSAGE